LQDKNDALALLDLEQADHEVDVYDHFLNSMADSLDDNLASFLILLNFQLSDQAYIYSKELDELHRPLLKELKYLYSLWHGTYSKFMFMYLAKRTTSVID
jgi:hypothetical protein